MEETRGKERKACGVIYCYFFYAYSPLALSSLGVVTKRGDYVTALFIIRLFNGVFKSQVDAVNLPRGVIYV